MKIKQNFEENEKKNTSGSKPKASNLLTETLLVQKQAYVIAFFRKREFPYLFSVLREMSYKSLKNTFFFHNSFPKKIE